MVTDSSFAFAAERVFVREAKQGECCSARLEIADNGEAYHLENNSLSTATVDEVKGLLHVKVKGETRWVLTPRDGAWIDQRDGRWVNRDALVKHDPEWTGVRINVQDQHGQAVEEFSFTYTIDGKNGRWDPMLVRPIPADHGKMEIKAPADCKIYVEIKHPDFVRGFNSPCELDRTSGAAELKAVFRRGKTVRGMVVDEESGQGVPDVAVIPMIFTPPSYSPDYERKVKTVADGSFTVRGVDGFIAIEHPDYVDETHLIEQGETIANVKLKKGLTLQGKVSDSSGKPLAGVEVDDGAGKSTLTGDDGRFTLHGLRKWNDHRWNLSFFKEGFNKHSFRQHDAPVEGLDVTLTPLPQLRGRVVRADGKPVGRFTLVCGPGANPYDFQCAEAIVDAKDGRFVIQPRALPEEGTDYWLGVRAEGAAPWEGVASQTVLESGEFSVVLQPGFSLSARLMLPESAGDGRIHMEPTDREPQEPFSPELAGKTLATRSMRSARGEPIVIPHLRTGEYQLSIKVKGASPLSLPVTIANGNVDLGELILQGTGSITGIVNEPFTSGKAWRFADGKIYVDGFDAKHYEPFMTFKADGEGRFRVDDIPSGRVTVMFDYNESADVINSVVRKVLVKEEKVSEVRFEGAGGAWSQPLRMVFDEKDAIPAYDGKRVVENVTDRKEMFRIDVLDAEGVVETVVEWSSDDASPPAIPDLAPGRWRIRVSDWLGSRGFDEGIRGEVTADVGEKRGPITISLGSKIISGRVTSSRETKRLVQVIAVGRNTGRVFYSRADQEGDFVIRYLPADEYLVHARDDEGGWCDLGVRRVDKPFTDYGEHALGDGGHLQGKIPREILRGKGDIRLSVESQDGVVVPVDEWENDGSYRFGHLKPGTWTIVGKAGDQEFLRSSVKVVSGATVGVKPSQD